MISHITPRVGVDCLRGRSYRRDNFRSLGPRGKVCFLLSQSALWWQQPNLGGQLIIRGTAHASGTPTDSIGQSATFHNPELWDVHNPHHTFHPHPSATSPIPSTPTQLPAHTHLPPPKGKQTVIWDHTPRFGSSVANNFLSLQTGSKYNLTARKGQWLAIISLEIQLGWESQRWTGRTCPRKSCPAKFSKRHMTNIKCIVNVAFSRRHSAIVI